MDGRSYSRSRQRHNLPKYNVAGRRRYPESTGLLGHFLANADVEAGEVNGVQPFSPPAVRACIDFHDRLQPIDRNSIHAFRNREGFSDGF
jgi:hypothetical protein